MLSDRTQLRAERDALYRFILRRTRNAAVAEDLAQETLTRLLVYERTRSIVDRAAMTYRIALNLVRDHFRLERRRPSEELNETIPCHTPAPEQVLMHREKVELFGRILATMPPLRREVLIRRRLHGQSHRQIAAEMNLKEAAVEKHMIRALDQLRQELAKAERRRGVRP